MEDNKKQIFSPKKKGGKKPHKKPANFAPQEKNVENNQNLTNSPKKSLEKYDYFYPEEIKAKKDEEDRKVREKNTRELKDEKKKKRSGEKF